MNIAKTEIELVKNSRLFDEAWYLKQYPDVAATKIDPIVHYLKYGALLDRNPGPNFDTKYYLQTYADVVKLDINPLIHYLRFGIAEGRSTTPFIRKKNTRIAIVLHVYYEDLVFEIASFIRNISRPFDLFVTTPLPPTSPSIKTLKAFFPAAKIIHHPNAGKDIGPFVSLLSNLQNYDLCCKIHTKRGTGQLGELWRRVLLKAVLGSKQHVDGIISAFENDKDLLMVGSKELYLSSSTTMFGNKENIDFLLGIIKQAHLIENEWGFFAGTMFWCRPQIFRPLINISNWLVFSENNPTADGLLEHALERIFGLLPVLQESGKIGTISIERQPHERRGIEIFTAPGTPDKNIPSEVLSRLNAPASGNARSATQTKTLLAPEKSHDQKNIRGDINPPTPHTVVIAGWLALIGEDQARTAIIRIDRTKEFPVCANMYRLDLEQHNINKGHHAFVFTPPTFYLNGEKHLVELIDKETNTTVKSIEVAWKHERRFVNLDGFLVNSLVEPIIPAPFLEEEKRCFAVMENIKRYLCETTQKRNASELVSVVMPTYNRAEVVGEAIESVLNQSYKNFELIILDDGSNDDTAKVIKKYDDKRIRFLKHAMNLGAGASRNHAINIARGDLMAYLDSDNLWNRQYLEAMVGAFYLLPNADAAYCAQTLSNGNDKPFAINFGAFNPSLLENNNYIDINALMHRKKIKNQVLEFDEALRRGIDWDFILNLSTTGTIYSVPAILSHYFFNRAKNTITGNHAFPDFRDSITKRHKRRLAQLKRALPDDNTSPLQPDLLAPKKGVTIIIPNYELLEDIRKCLSLIQKHPLIETIVIDNASSPEVVSFLEQMECEGRIRLIKNKENYGFTYAVNQGLRLARPGNDILLLNNDALLTPTSLFELQKAAYESDDIGITAPRQVLFGGTPSIQAHVPYANPLDECDVNLSKHHDNIVKVPLFHNGHRVELKFAPFFCVYIKRHVINKTKGLDAELGRHYRSDRVMCDYVRHVLGLRIIYTSDAVVYHHFQKATNTLRSNETQEKSSDYISKRNQWEPELREKLGFKQPFWSD